MPGQRSRWATRRPSGGAGADPHSVGRGSGLATDARCSCLVSRASARRAWPRRYLREPATEAPQVWVGRAFEQHTAVPFFPFTEALAFKMTETSLPPLAEVLQRWPELARLLPDAGTEQPTRDGHDTQLRVFRAATAFFHALAEVRPLVLLLDDLHWADTTSLSLVLYMCRHLAGSRILVLCTYRDVEVDREHPLAEPARELVRERLADVGRPGCHRCGMPKRSDNHLASPARLNWPSIRNLSRHQETNEHGSTHPLNRRRPHGHSWPHCLAESPSR